MVVVILYRFILKGFFERVKIEWRFELSKGMSYIFIWEKWVFSREDRKGNVLKGGSGFVMLEK